MRVGDKVRHKMTGQTMEIKRLSGSVATCRTEPYTWTFYGIEYTHNVAVCLIENLELIEDAQPTLFDMEELKEVVNG